LATRCGPPGRPATASKPFGRPFADCTLCRNPVHASPPACSQKTAPQLHPGDVLSAAEGKLPAALLPGFWSHAALFSGRAPNWRMGVGEQAHAAKHWRKFRDTPRPLGVVIEAVSPRVRVCPLETSLNADPSSCSGQTCHRGNWRRWRGSGASRKSPMISSLISISPRASFARSWSIAAITAAAAANFARETPRTVHLTATTSCTWRFDELARAGGSAAAPFQRSPCCSAAATGAPMPRADRIVSLLRRIRKGWRPARRTTLPLK